MGTNRLDKNEAVNLTEKEAVKLLETLDGLYKMLEMADLVSQSAANRLEGNLLREMIMAKETINSAKMRIQRCWAAIKTALYQESVKH